ncbi:MAG TPA: class I SAM-dependent methyltransferase [Firmicutes bacterium]|nr:class I SAM-dependent methyltransferase [Bacillota bacterium]HHY98440.1 class I SAM-dependent methyltransferase [Bacillota bacterium]
MKDHYFSERPEAPHREKLIFARLRGSDYRFWTDSSVFSRERVDRGTRLLIDAMEIPPDATILDLGCGYGPVGIVAARLAPQGVVYMVDINERAIWLSRRNAQENNVRNVVVLQGEGFVPVKDLEFDVILTNPPIRAGRKVLIKLFEGARDHLGQGGTFWMVARTKQGVLTLASEMERIFGNADEVERGGGYRVIRSYMM